VLATSPLNLVMSLYLALMASNLSWIIKTSSPKIAGISYFLQQKQRRRKVGGGGFFGYYCILTTFFSWGKKNTETFFWRWSDPGELNSNLCFYLSQDCG
jgi:hypothetical protein